METLTTLNSGDILLFHGEGFWFSKLVEWVTGSNFSHVAMVLRDPTYIHSSLQGLYMIESGEEKFPDAVSHRIIRGVQIVDLNKVISTYSGKIYVRKFNSLNKEVQFEILREIWDKVKNCGYDEYPWDLIRTAFHLNWGDNCRTNKFVCSALICFLLEQLDILKVPALWDLFTPQDFAPDGRIDKILKYKYSRLMPL